MHSRVLGWNCSLVASALVDPLAQAVPCALEVSCCPTWAAYHVGCRGGRTYGHAVSRDFVHWAHMPISIWNDRPYDEHAIYTGSATVVDGKVIMQLFNILQ